MLCMLQGSDPSVCGTAEDCTCSRFRNTITQCSTIARDDANYEPLLQQLCVVSDVARVPDYIDNQQAEVALLVSLPCLSRASEETHLTCAMEVPHNGNPRGLCNKLTVG